jgi:site-specific recombinase XerD
MNELYFPNPIILQRLQTGPLGGHIDAFVKHLSHEGYAVWTIKYSMRLLADLTTWMQQQQVVITALAEQPVNTFFQQRYQTLRPHRDDRAILVKLLTYLRKTEIIVEPIKVVDNPAIDNVLQEFRQHLIDQRNLAPITIQTYLGTVEHFLMHCYAAKPLKLETLSVPEITTFMLQQARHYSAGHTQLIASGLRNFFRFLLQQGVTKTNFAQCVLAPARRRLSTLPKFMKADDVERLLQSVDQETPTGRRNFAILQLLARLGLRSGEVASLTLDDINWDKGTIIIGGKGGHKDQLPLPHEVGQAIANYLCDGRPSCSTRHVFVRLRAPLRGFFNGAAVGTIVRRALNRAGLHPALKGAHLLRHSLATRLLREGASLTEIGELLRHRNLNTTQIYAKVDEIALRRLAPPWLGGEI